MKKSELTSKAPSLGDKDLGVSGTQLIPATGNHLPAYAPDDGPLSAEQLAAFRRDAAKNLPRGKVISRKGLV